MRLVAISDVHLNDSKEPLYGALIRLFDSIRNPGDVLVIGGDLFDLFVGNKMTFLNRFSELLSSIRQCGERGVIVHYIEGNHDFQLEDVFRNFPLLQLHSEEIRFSLSGKSFLVAHGDLVDRNDYLYIGYRSFLRSWPMRRFIQGAPDSAITKIADWLSERSKGKPPEELSTEQRSRLRETYRKYALSRFDEGIQYLILGHCHESDDFVVERSNRQHQYVNVGYPKVHRTYLEWTPKDDLIRRVQIEI